MNNIFGVLIGIAVIVGTIFIGIYIIEDQRVRIAKTGLEECKYSRDQPIWVKDCNSYIKIKIEENNLKENK